MCGIYGMVSRGGGPLRWPEHLTAMAADLRHRGPDAHGEFRSDGVALGVQRLRIVDRRPAADQPFATPRSALVCNGEIYNDHELRAAYRSHAYRSRSDVEPLLPLLDQAGPAGLHEVDGMFACAHWHTETRTLTLARDIAGEKPLYYLERDGEVWFASEVRALLHHPGLSRRADDQGLEAFLALGYVPEPATLFEGIRKIPAGRALVFHRSAPPRQVEYELDPMLPNRPELGATVRRSVARRCRADVPVGVFLSGGLDSTLVAALARECLVDTPVHSFAARFADASYDESRWSRLAAASVGTTHHEITIDDAALYSAWTRLASHAAEPLADPAILPTVTLAEASRRTVGVVLGGEGADELFGGYPTYHGHLWADLLRPTMNRRWGQLHRLLEWGGASHDRIPLRWLLERFAAHADEPFPGRHLAWQAWGLMPLLDRQHRQTLAARWTGINGAGPDDRATADRAMELDWRTALRDSLLVKLDRATMMFGLEARAPFVSRELRNAAWALPLEQRLTLCRSKVALRRMAARYVPDAILRRRKRGLSVPIGRWMNGALRGEVDRLWASPALDRVQSVFPEVPLTPMLTAHRAGRRNYARPVWTVTCLLQWIETGRVT